MTEENTSAEIAEIQEAIRTDPRAYWKDQEKQARLGELLASREDAAETPATVDEPEDLAQIREVMRTDPGRYWSDKGMQARLGQLLQGPEPSPDNEIGIRAFEYAKADIMNDERLAPVIKGWGSRAEDNVRVYYDRMNDLLTGDIETMHAQEITEQFVGLDEEMSPALARWAVEMRRADSGVRVDLEAAREPFLSTEEGQALRQIWGDKFDQNLTRYVARTQALRQAVSPEAFDRFLDKFEALSPSAAMAVIKWVVRT